MLIELIKGDNLYESEDHIHVDWAGHVLNGPAVCPLTGVVCQQRLQDHLFF